MLQSLFVSKGQEISVEGRPVTNIVYVFGVTIALLVLIFKLALNPEASSIAENTIDGAYRLLYVIVVTYLATNARAPLPMPSYRCLPTAMPTYC